MLILSALEARSLSYIDASTSTQPRMCVPNFPSFLPGIYIHDRLGSLLVMSV
ncbi:hypothetical protein K474DRAFT_1660767 [Panus rudis PR-1116 ss-1]|nr:hypothetical protein K474DRAFT_1660767 [Panus rudis PR-1116 ss-1]